MDKNKDPQKVIHAVEEKRKAQRKKQEQKNRIILSAVALIVLVILVLVLVKGCSKKDDPVVQPDTAPTDAVVTPDPDATATPEPVSAPTAQPVVYLPILTKGPTDVKRITITLDDIKSVDNLNAIIDICESNKVELTLFPMGKDVASSAELQSALRRAYSLGFEIGNYTYNNKNLYSLTDEEMAYEIFAQNQAVSKALGFKYDMHFLRTRGGKGENDLRTHQYLVQLGSYKGIAHWNQDGSDIGIKTLKNNLKAGYVYRFTTSDADLRKLTEFIPYAVSQGYDIVTLSVFCNLETNSVSPLPAEEETIPAPYPFVYDTYITLGGKDCTQAYAVQLLQKRLIELGYLPADTAADGDYGNKTKTAVTLFQNYNGLGVDGIAGAETQRLLFSDAAKAYAGTDTVTEPTGVE